MNIVMDVRKKPKCSEDATCAKECCVRTVLALALMIYVKIVAANWQENIVFINYHNLPERFIEA